MQTIHTKVDTNIYPFMEDMVNLLAPIERQFYADMQKTDDINNLKKEYLKKYKIHARYLDSILFSIKKRKNIRKANLKLEKQTLVTRIKSYKSHIKKLNKKKDKKNKDYFKLHNMKRKLHRMEEKLKNLNPTIIFGGKKLWNKQFNCEDHSVWLEKWQTARNSQFTFIGTSIENYGNSLCQYKNGNLQIRVPYALEEKYGKHVIIENLLFPYKQESLNLAIQMKQPIFYRFIRENGSWYVHVSFEQQKPVYASNENNGAIGVDLNIDVIAWSHVDFEGNLKDHNYINYNINSKTTNQTTAILSQKIIELVDIAVQKQCPIVIENLDFNKKKAEFNYHKENRMINNFAYNKFKELLIARANSQGIKVHERNPAYSTTIGLMKFMSMYGISSHTAAALVLARRLLRKSERVPSKYASCLPVDSHKHVWSKWSKLRKKFKSMKRHEFFLCNKDANSVLEVNLNNCKLKDEKLLWKHENALQFAGEIPAPEFLSVIVPLGCLSKSRRSR